MNIKSNNLPRITAVLLFLITLSGAIFLYQQSPFQADTIGNLTFRTDGNTHLVLSGNNFQCNDADENTQTLFCTVTIENELLTMQLTTTQGIGSTITSCQTTFGGQDVACRGSYSMRYRGPVIILEDTLGISDARFETLRLTNWPDQLSERTWFRIMFVITMLIVFNTAVLLWQWLAKRQIKQQWQTAVTLLSSISLFVVLYLSSAILLLFQGWID